MECSDYTRVLAGDSSSTAERLDTSDQFTQNVLGTQIMGAVVPIVCNAAIGDGDYKQVVIHFGDGPYHRCFSYKTYSHKACCKAVLRFNIDHYYKCFLPGAIGTDGNITTPYVYNRCRKCNASIQDDCGGQAEYTNTYNWTNGFIARKSKEVLQDFGACKTQGIDVVKNTYQELATTVEPVTTSLSGCSKCKGGR